MKTNYIALNLLLIVLLKCCIPSFCAKLLLRNKRNHDEIHHDKKLFQQDFQHENDIMNHTTTKLPKLNFRHFILKEINQLRETNSQRLLLSEDEITTSRVLLKYKSNDCHQIIVSNSIKIYYDFKHRHLISVEMDSIGYDIIASHDDIISIEHDSIWTEQGIEEKILSESELHQYIIDNPNLVHIVNKTLVYNEEIAARKHSARNNNETETQNDDNNDRRNLYDYYDYEKMPYGIKQTQADQLSFGYKSRPMVCVVDTGALAAHPDFDDYLLNGKARSNNADGKRLRWNNDMRGHGTHIAGTISAKINNNYGVRGMGAIPTYVTRGLDDTGNARESDIMESIDQCVIAGSRVISLSLAGTSMSNSFKKEIDTLYARNVMIVAAAGNQGKYSESYPASYYNVVSVGAVDEGENLWSNSNYGPWLELTAPGVMVLSLGLYQNNQYKFAFYTGTSMATPHVAAAAAMLWSYFPECTTTQIRYAMARTAKDKGNRGCDNYYGYGIVQVKSAYNFLAANSCRNSGWGRSVGSGKCSL